jgi:hypothetical protein
MSWPGVPTLNWSNVSSADFESNVDLLIQSNPIVNGSQEDRPTVNKNLDQWLRGQIQTLISSSGTNLLRQTDGKIQSVLETLITRRLAESHYVLMLGSWMEKNRDAQSREFWFPPSYLLGNWKREYGRRVRFLMHFFEEDFFRFEFYGNGDERRHPVMLTAMISRNVFYGVPFSKSRGGSRPKIDVSYSDGDVKRGFAIPRFTCKLSTAMLGSPDHKGMSISNDAYDLICQVSKRFQTP